MWRNVMTVLVLLALTGLGVWGVIEARQPGRLALREVRFQGAVHTDMDQALERMAVPKGSNLLRLDPEALRRQLLTLPWVQEARVVRRFPDTLAVTLTERTAVCSGRRGETLVLLDEYGQVIKPLESNDPLVLPVVTPPGRGPEASLGVVRLMNLLGHYPRLKARLSEARGMAGGRWVLHTRQGVRILLKEPAEQALDLLSLLQERFEVLDRQVEQVDLRIPRQVAVRPAAGA